MDKYKEIFQYIKDHKSYLRSKVSLKAELSNALTEMLTDKLKELKLLEKFCSNYPIYQFIIEDSPTTANYLSINLNLHQYYNEINRKTDNYSNKVSVNINELFMNCSTVVISNYGNSPSYGNQNGLFDEALFYIYEFICELFEYTCIMYTTAATTSSSKLIPYLDKTYTPTLKYNNKRGKNEITIYTKLIKY